MDIFESKQKRANITVQIRELMDRCGDAVMDAVDKSTLENLEKEFDKINASIAAEEKQLERERIAGEIIDKKNAVEGQDKANKLFAKALTGLPEHLNAYRASLNLSNDSQAGNLTAPMAFTDELIRGLDDELFIRQISKTVGPIGAGQSLGYPYRATAASDADWTTEVAQSAEDTTLAFGRREFKPQRLTKCIKISKTLIDHAPNTEEIVKNEIVSRIAIAQENAYLNGDGTNKPLGVFVASNDGITTGRDVSTGNTTSAVTFDGLINAKYGLKGQYIPKAHWLMHRDLVKMVAKLKDTEGQYLWQPSAIVGQPDMLLGCPVHMSEYAPNTFTASQYVAVLGDFADGYWVCDATSIQIEVLRELFALYNQIGYNVEYYGDGAPVIAEAFVRVKLAASQGE